MCANVSGGCWLCVRCLILTMTLMLSSSRDHTSQRCISHHNPMDMQFNRKNLKVPSETKFIAKE